MDILLLLAELNKICLLICSMSNFSPQNYVFNYYQSEFNSNVRGVLSLFIEMKENFSYSNGFIFHLGLG